MLSIAAKRVSQFLTIILSATVLAGCFGQGDGPTAIAGTPAPPPPPPPPAGFCDPIFNFEDACGAVSFTNFEGGDASIFDNPDIGGLNTSDKVARMLKFPVAGGGTFGGTAIQLPSGIDFSAGEAFTMKVWSSRQVPVLFKFEGLNQERSLDHSGSGTWEELCYDFTGTTNGPAATDITVIFDITVMGASDTDPDNWTFYFDEIEQVASCGGGGTGIALPITFEDGDAAFYELTDFGGVATTLVADPDDAANTVASTNKPPGAETWGGTTVANGSGFGALPFSATETSMTLRVYSPDAGIPVRLKVEDVTDDTISVETEAMTTVAGAWETLTFDFSTPAAGTAALNLANTYDKASVFFNFGTDGTTAGDKTYLWEDMSFVTGSGGGGSTPIDFESGSYTFNDFGGGVAAVVPNPDASGINVSVQVAQMQKFAGDVFGGSTLDLGGSVDLAAGDSYTMKVRALRSVVVTFKLETGGQETTATHTGSGTWEELCFDFTGVAATVSGITVIFDNGTAGDAANDPDNWTFQFDDIEQVASCPPTGGSGTGVVPDVVIYATDPNVPVDLQFGVDYTGFEPFGSGSTFDNNVVTDPDYNPAFGVTTGDGYGAQVGQFALVGFAAGFATGYETLDFKAKGLNNDLIRVKFLDAGDYIDVTLTSSAYSTDLGNGWYQVSIPLADFTGVDTATALLFETDNTAAASFTFLLTDFGFSSASAGGQLAVNGDFETGDLTGWTVFDSSNSGNGGTISVASPGSSGTFAGNINITAPGNPTLKQANLAAGQLTPNQVVTVTFDWKGTDANGGVANIVLFSELSGGGVSDTFTIFDGAGFPADWTTVGPLDITTGNDVSGGVTLQIAAICGGDAGCVSDVSIDNVSITVP